MSAEIVQRVDSDVRLNRGRRPPPSADETLRAVGVKLLVKCQPNPQPPSNPTVRK